MASSQRDNENTEIPDSHESDMFRKMEAILQKRKKTIRHIDNEFPCTVIVDAADVPDLLKNDDCHQVEPHKQLYDNNQLLGTFVEKAQMLKQTSAMEMDVVEEETTDEHEILQAISRIRKQCGKVFKEMINTQVNFNEHLNNKLLANGSKHKEHIKKHELLIQNTCKFDRGIESLIQCDTKKLGAHVKDMEIKNVDEFKSVYEDLAHGMLSEVYKTGEKTFSNHEHLLSIKEYNKTLSTDEIMVEVMSAVKLDPFTKQPILNPVLNEVCKHVYDQISVDKMFQNKLIVSCPYMGCSNKKFTKKDLVADTVVSNDSE